MSLEICKYQGKYHLSNNAYATYSLLLLQSSQVTCYVHNKYFSHEFHTCSFDFPILSLLALVEQFLMH